jgi:hypothetical protein
MLYRFLILQTHPNGELDTQKQLPYTQYTRGLFYWEKDSTGGDLKHKRFRSFCKLLSII